jgi:hypothetical protein
MGMDKWNEEWWCWKPIYMEQKPYLTVTAGLYNEMSGPSCQYVRWLSTLYLYKFWDLCDSEPSECCLELWHDAVWQIFLENGAFILKVNWPNQPFNWDWVNKHQNQLTKLTTAENTINLGRHKLLSKTCILAMKSRCRDQLIRDPIQTEFHPNNTNKENKFSLSRSWKPLIHYLK